jgi:D-aminoacyl-tRNA deacylase
MIGLLQRVAEAEVRVEAECVARISRGLAVLVGVERGDGQREARRLAERLLAYRVFPDAAGRLNLSVVETKGQVLLVPNFTLAADTDSGNRPSFSSSAPPEVAGALFDALAEACEALGIRPALGRFGADMQVSLINDGPVTFRLRVPPEGRDEWRSPSSPPSSP